VHSSTIAECASEAKLAVTLRVANNEHANRTQYHHLDHDGVISAHHHPRGVQGQRNAPRRLRRTHRGRTHGGSITSTFKSRGRTVPLRPTGSVRLWLL